MIRVRRLAAVSALVAGAAIVPLTGSARAATGFPANVVAWSPSSTSTQTYPTEAYGGTPASTRELATSWRVVNGLGNGAEKFLATCPNGRVMDLGGRYLIFSDDSGQTWTAAEPQNPLVNAEGALACAPNGDIVGVTWDPYGGDTLYSYKWDNGAKQWLYSVDPHTPFYDRPEIAVVPGPFSVPQTGGGTQQVPYLSFVSSHGSPVFYATDGLNYENPVQNGAALTQWVPTKPDPTLDWDQSQVWGPMHALGGGWALDFSGGGGAEDFSLADNLNSNSYFLFDPQDLSLHPLTLPDPAASLTSNLQVDSLGRLHEVVIHKDGGGFDYRMSSDGGKTWQTLPVAYPPHQAINSNTGGQVMDLRVNAAQGVAAVDTRTDVGTAAAPPQAGDPEQDYVYKFDISGAAPVLQRRSNLGVGNTTTDTAYLGTYERTGHRYDFASLAILPGGRVAASFMDESTHMPFPTTGIDIEASAVAIELGDVAPVSTPEGPAVPLIPLAGVAAVLGGLGLRRRRRVAQAASGYTRSDARLRARRALRTRR